MFEWLLYIPLWFSNVQVPQQDYVGMVAAEAAYAALLPNKAAVKPKVARKDCTTCKGTGRITQGDGHETECSDCDPELGAINTTQVLSAPASPQKIETAPTKSAGFPPRTFRSVP